MEINLSFDSPNKEDLPHNVDTSHKLIQHEELKQLYSARINRMTSIHLSLLSSLSKMLSILYTSSFQGAQIGFKNSLNQFDKTLASAQISQVSKLLKSLVVNTQEIKKCLNNLSPQSIDDGVLGSILGELDNLDFAVLQKQVSLIDPSQATIPLNNLTMEVIEDS